MSNQEIIQELEKKINVGDPDNLSLCEACFAHVLEVLNQHGIKYDADRVLGLAAHCYAMVNRVMNNEAVMEIEQDIKEQIDPKYYAIAAECVEELAKQKTILNKESEEFLIAIHVQSLMESEG